MNEGYYLFAILIALFLIWHLLIKTEFLQTVSCLDWHSQDISLLESLARVVHTEQAEHTTQEDDKDIPAHSVPGHQVPSKVEMEDAGPDK